MTTPNSSDSTHENTETSKRSSNKNINSLLKFGIERELGNPIDPRKFDAYKKEPDYNNIRLNMKDLCKEDPVNL